MVIVDDIENAKNRGEIMFVVCNEHLNEAIDEFVDVYEQPPDVYELAKVSFTDWTSPNTCDKCDHVPRFLVV